MSYLLKDPGAALDYSVDWAAEYLGADTLSASSWTVEPDDGAMTIDGSSFEPGSASAKVSGGAAGQVYRLTNHVTSVGGRSDRRSIMIRVEKR